MHHDVQKLRETVAALHQELPAVESTDPEVRALLVSALQDIASKLDARAGGDLAPATEPAGSGGQLAAAAQQLETDHPTLAATLRSLVEGLSRMGI